MSTTRIQAVDLFELNLFVAHRNTMQPPNDKTNLNEQINKMARQNQAVRLLHIVCLLNRIDCVVSKILCDLLMKELKQYNSFYFDWHD